MEYVAEPISATVTVASTLVSSGSRIEVEDTQYGAESAIAAPMTHREVSTASAVFVLWSWPR